MSRDLISKLRTTAPGRPIVVLTGGCLRTQRFTTPAELLVRHRSADIVAVIDEQADSMGAQPVLSDLPRWSWAPPIPIVGSMADFGSTPASVVFGLDLPAGTELLLRHRDELIAASQAGRVVVHGLADSIDEGMVELRARPGSAFEVWPTSDEGDGARACRVITLATGAAVLATDAAVSLNRSMANGGATTDWLATTWLGMLLRGAGRDLSTLRSSSVTPAFERGVKSLESVAEAVVIDGGGELIAPLVPASTSGAINGTRAQFHLLCHAATSDDDSDVLVEAAARAVAAHRAVGVRSTLVGVVLDTSALSASAAARALADGWALGVPTIERNAELDPIAQHILSVARLRSSVSTEATPAADDAL